MDSLHALLTVAAAAALSLPVLAEEKPSPAFDRIKALAGEWEGSARGGHGSAEAQPTVASVKVVSGGSAVMLVTDPGTPHEMVTLFHRDDDDVLVATHYCSAMNQPRMKARPSSDPSKLAFEFVDGTNLGAHPAHMQRLVLDLAAVDRHTQEWTFDAGGKTTTRVFEMKRKR